MTIKQLEEYVWDEWKGRGADEKQPKGKPRDKNDHQVENIHRLLLHEPRHIPYEFTQEYASRFFRPEEGAFDYHDSDLDPYD